MRLRTVSIGAALALGASVVVVGPALAQHSFDVNTTDDTVDVSPGDGVCADATGQCSLRAAVQEANARRGAAIRLDGGATYSLDLAGAGDDTAATGDLDVISRIRILGDGATVDATALGDRAFDVLASAELQIFDLTVTGARPASGDSGGGVRSAGTLAISDSHFEDNVVEGTGASGGAVFNAGGILEIEDSELRGNGATRAGGAIEANAGSTQLDGVRLIDNQTGPMPGNGGGLHLTGAGTVQVTRSVVTGNNASAEGGGLWNSATGTMTVSRTELSGNTASGVAADQGGGALFNDGGTLVVDRAQIEGNVADGASGSGGGILNDGGVLEVSSSVIDGNTAVRAGGGIEADVGSTTLSRSTLANNDAGPTPGNGGGLHLTGAGTVDVSRSQVNDNSASAEGGGLWNSGSGTMTVSRTTFQGNTASGAMSDQGGGALFNDGGTLNVERSLIRNNTADGAAGSGGGIFNNDGELVVSRTVLLANASIRAGGGIEALVGSTTLDRVVLRSNTTGASPGNGGGLHLTGAGTVDIDASTVVDNTAAAEGGGLWNSATGTMIVTATDVFSNQAPVGPNVFNDGGTFILNGTPVPVGP